MAKLNIYTFWKGIFVCWKLVFADWEVNLVRGRSMFGSRTKLTSCFVTLNFLIFCPVFSLEFLYIFL